MKSWSETNSVAGKQRIKQQPFRPTQLVAKFQENIKRSPKKSTRGLSDCNRSCCASRRPCERVVWTVNVKSTPEQTMRTRGGGGSEVPLYSFFNFGARWMWVPMSLLLDLRLKPYRISVIHFYVSLTHISLFVTVNITEICD
jgi:hypothetical protein